MGQPILKNENFWVAVGVIAKFFFFCSSADRWSTVKSAGQTDKNTGQRPSEATGIRWSVQEVPVCAVGPERLREGRL
ncbi:MAG: hypothetical protein Ct9H300mP16_01610 [Pseudomonadota bacterium]|nr:MAG: hypothetical protein Ct9H300mP16_01610 [Pseudomonadota bacterium]